ncbi:hypothetical protein WS89_04240 [Burkholderia sp. MSMB1072]|nr:hypothetical protein WS89_04240 [Burkholderia sp. MSMB1072]
MRMTFGGRVLVGTGMTDDGSTTLQVNNSLLVSRFGSAQKIVLGASVLNTINSYSVASNASPLTINATTDANNSAVTGGNVGLNFQILGATKLAISQGGNVLVGPTVDDGVNSLQVSGGVRAGNYFINSQATGDSGLFGFNNSNGPNIAFYGSGTIGAGSLVFSTAFAERARFVASGRMLIGMTTDDGANAVQVYSAGGNGTGLLAVAGGNTTGMGGAVSFAANVGSAPMSQVKGVLDNKYSGGSYDQGGLAFLTRPAGNGAAGALTERMRVTNSGRVLIGTASDDGSSLLQVAGNTYFYGVSYFGQTSAKAWINADANAYYVYGQGNALVGSAGASGYVGLVSANAERLRVTASGRILIGTTADNGGDLLQVAGTVRGMNSIGALIASNGGGTGQTSVILSRDGAPADQKKWELMQGGDGAFSIRATNDAYSAAQNALCITRGSGSNVGNMMLMQNGGHVLVGTLTDDGANLLQVAGSGMFANAVSTYYGANDTQVTLSTSNWSGGATLEVFNKANTTKKNIAFAPWGGRVLIGTATDDGSTLLQVSGKGRFTGDVRTSDSNGFRVVFGNYGAFFRNDGANVYFLQTASGDQSGLWNGYRPFAWNLSTGYVSIDSTGAGTTLGGDVGVSGVLTVSKDARVATAGGNLMVGGVSYASGTNATIAPDGNVWGTQWGSQWLRTFLDNTFVHKSGDTLTSDLRVRAPNNSTAAGAVFARPDNTALAWLHGSMSTGGAYGYSSWATMNPDGSWRANVITVNGTDNSATIMNLRANGVTYFSDRITLDRAGWQADIGLHNNRPGYDSWTYLRARDGGGLEVINSAYNGVPWNVSNDGETWQGGNLHVGGATLQTDGNLWQGYRGRWLSDDMGKLDDAWNKANDAQLNRADRGAQCPIVALEEVGPYDMTQGTQFWIRRDSPWIMNGIGFAGGNRCWVRFAWLRNN